MSEYHIPVLLNESVSALVGPSDGVYVDATFGGGGHSREILSRLSEKGRLIAFDRDGDALEGCDEVADGEEVGSGDEVSKRDLRGDSRVTFVQDNFRFVDNYVKWYFRRGEGSREECESERGEGRGEGVNGILADLGVSSHQFDTPERGFSFRFDAPLDMRMDQKKQARTAADILNSYPEEKIASVLDLFGEVQGSRKMAALIVKARSSKKIETTMQLNEAIAPMLPKFAEHKMLAKVYQALRIEVNGEMRALEKFLYGAADALLPGGRLVVITYHSLEDRMVKNFIKAGNIEGIARTDVYGNVAAPLAAVNRKPIIPGEEEIAANTRARSAKLRIAEKVAD